MEGRLKFSWKSVIDEEFSGYSKNWPRFFGGTSLNFQTEGVKINMVACEFRNKCPLNLPDER
jgi:hypothetical protein